MEKIYDIDEIISNLESFHDTYFLSFLQTNAIEAGILRLCPNEKDTQEPHQSDELYYVIDGNGFIQIDDKSYPIKAGKCIFVPSKSKHKFYGNTDILIVLYIFGRDIASALGH